MIKPTNNIPGSGCWQRDIQQFLDGEYSIAEVVVPEGRSAGGVAANVRVAQKRGGYPVRVILRSGRVFLMREEP